MKNPKDKLVKICLPDIYVLRSKTPQDYSDLVIDDSKKKKIKGL